jgi:hypothetical protein
MAITPPWRLLLLIKELQSENFAIDRALALPTDYEGAPASLGTSRRNNSLSMSLGVKSK